MLTSFLLLLFDQIGSIKDLKNINKKCDLKIEIYSSIELK